MLQGGGGGGDWITNLVPSTPSNTEGNDQWMLEYSSASFAMEGFSLYTGSKIVAGRKGGGGMRYVLLSEQPLIVMTMVSVAWIDQWFYCIYSMRLHGDGV